MFNRLEVGDEVDLVSYNPNDARTMPRLIGSSISQFVQQMARTDSQESLIVNLRMPEIREAVDQAVERGDRIAVVIHDDSRESIEDAVRIEGVWRPVLIQQSGSLRPVSADDLRLVFMRGNAIGFIGDQVVQSGFTLVDGYIQVQLTDAAAMP